MACYLSTAPPCDRRSREMAWPTKGDQGTHGGSRSRHTSKTLTVVVRILKFVIPQTDHAIRVICLVGKFGATL